MNIDKLNEAMINIWKKIPKEDFFKKKGKLELPPQIIKFKKYE